MIGDIKRAGIPLAAALLYGVLSRLLLLVVMRSPKGSAYQNIAEVAGLVCAFAASAAMIHGMAVFHGYAREPAYEFVVVRKLWRRVRRG